ncbi:Exosome complex component like [Actinidia chinensis var. chinensis]|uniref:Exosome complex component like n=1 Tax=Actinidia chinensis var. chinensis TaxID=1590841 RepID=A0A2R6QP26_ACTCC|nr:Exosome complex component like [Actinidia chinensis var. chinensis]
MEYVSPEGLRLDGRRPMEMRQIRGEIGAVSRADGSAVFEMGNTKVIAAVYGRRERNKICMHKYRNLALADAGIPMCNLVASCSAGYLNSTALLDLNYVEDSAGGPDVTVGILPKLDKVTLLQGSFLGFGSELVDEFFILM